MRDQGIAYTYIPVDFDAPTHADFEAFAAAMEAHTEKKVHVHCATNYRVTAFCGVYTVESGLDRGRGGARFVHDVWDPSEFPAWQSFITDEQARIRG